MCVTNATYNTNRGPDLQNPLHPARQFCCSTTQVDTVGERGTRSNLLISPFYSTLTMNAPGDDEEEDRKPNSWEKEQQSRKSDYESTDTEDDSDKKPKAEDVPGSGAGARKRRANSEPIAAAPVQPPARASRPPARVGRPPGELIDGESRPERRRRLNRLSAQKKRAKKLNELGELKDEHARLTQENRNLAEENGHLRERIELVKRFLPTLAPQAAAAAAPPVAAAAAPNPVATSNATNVAAPAPPPPPIPIAAATNPTTAVTSPAQAQNASNQQQPAPAVSDAVFLLAQAIRGQQVDSGNTTTQTLPGGTSPVHALQQVLLGQVRFCFGQFVFQTFSFFR